MFHAFPTSSNPGGFSVHWSGVGLPHFGRSTHAPCGVAPRSRHSGPSSVPAGAGPSRLSTERLSDCPQVPHRRVVLRQPGEIVPIESAAGPRVRQTARRGKGRFKRLVQPAPTGVPKPVETRGHVILQLLTIHQTRPYRIQMNVVADRSDRPPRPTGSPCSAHPCDTQH